MIVRVFIIGIGFGFGACCSIASVVIETKADFFRSNQRCTDHRSAQNYLRNPRRPPKPNTKVIGTPMYVKILKPLTPKPQTLNPKPLNPYTLNPKPLTLNPKGPEPYNPTPQSPAPEGPEALKTLKFLQAKPRTQQLTFIGFRV